MPYKDPIIALESWEHIVAAAKKYWSSEPVHLFGSLYLYAQKLGLHERSAVERQECNWRYVGDVSLVCPPADASASETEQIQFIFELLSSLSQTLHTSDAAEAGGCYHKELQPLPEMQDLLAVLYKVQSLSFTIVPYTFADDPDKAVTDDLDKPAPDLGKTSVRTRPKKPYMSRSGVLLASRWNLLQMAVRSTLQCLGKEYHLFHHLLRHQVHDSYFPYVDELEYFQERYSYPKQGKILLLLAAPREDYDIIREDGQGFFPNVKNICNPVELAMDTDHLIRLCIESKIDILIMPEMLIVQEVRDAIQNALRQCHTEQAYDNKPPFPWLTVAGSCHEHIDSMNKNTSIVFGPFGQPLWSHEKLCPFPITQGKDTNADYIYENIDPGKEIHLVDIPTLGRAVDFICRDYLEIANCVAGNFLDVWPTLYLVPAYSPRLEPFETKGKDQRDSLGAATVVQNALPAIVLPENSENAGSWLEKQRHVVVSRQPAQPDICAVSSDDFTFWKHLFVVRLG